MEDNKAIQKIVGEHIREYRLKNHMTLDTLAKFLGITQGFLGLIERGKRGLSFKNLLKLADIFNVSVDTFFEETDNKAPETFDEDDMLKIRIIKKLDGLTQKELIFVMQTLMSLNNLKAERSEAIPQEE
jgi:transcriptional regulator with XRE-family HTH domain